MKIAVCGKGGSGKSTVVVALANEFERRGNRVLVVDSDESNTGLHWMMGLEAPPRPLMEFVGGKDSVKDRMWSGGFTIDGGETSLSIWQQETIDPAGLPAANTAGPDSRRLVVTGKIDRTFEGCACPMGVVTREFLKKLRVDDDQIAIVDMEAGIEHFGRGIESTLDALLAVVEPSLESLNLAAKTRELAQASGALFAGAVVNKVRSEDALARLSDELAKRGIALLGSLAFHERLLDDGLLGRPVDLGQDAAEATAIVDRLLQVTTDRKGA
jgi:CO dehydrogenase maturation factor